MSNDAAQVMRRAVLAAVPVPATAARRLWLQPLLVAATIALMIGTGAVAGRHAANQQPIGSPGDTATAAENDERPRQLQFAAPGTSCS